MKNLIGNVWNSASTNEYVEVRNPYNHMILDTVPNSSYDDVNEAVKVSDTLLSIGLEYQLMNAVKLC